MSLALTGRTIALAEGRQLEELSQMLEKEGATILRCPLIDILDAPDPAPVLAWLRELIAGRFDLVILLTGEGLRRLVACAEKEGLRAVVLAALSRTRTLTRGPKPGQALKEIGLAPTIIAAAPTTDGVIASLKQESLPGLKVGVQLYSESNPPLEEYLKQSGAHIHSVLPYVYAPKSDNVRVIDMIHRLAGGQVDVLVFTSSPQVERLFTVAQEANVEPMLGHGLERTRLAAVGPIVAETLRRHGARVDLCPEQGFVMKNLVQMIKRCWEAVR